MLSKVKKRLATAAFLFEKKPVEKNMRQWRCLRAGFYEKLKNVFATLLFQFRHRMFASCAGLGSALLLLACQLLKAMPKKGSSTLILELGLGEKNSRPDRGFT